MTCPRNRSERRSEAEVQPCAFMLIIIQSNSTAVPSMLLVHCWGPGDPTGSSTDVWIPKTLMSDHSRFHQVQDKSSSLLELTRNLQVLTEPRVGCGHSCFNLLFC